MSRFSSPYNAKERAAIDAAQGNGPQANDADDPNTPFAYQVVSPSTMHSAAKTTETLVRAARWFGRMGGGGGSGSRFSGGSGGDRFSGASGAGGGFFSNRPYGDRFSPPASFIGPVEAPNAFQSGRMAVNNIGIRGGGAVARIGLEQLASTTGALSDEDDAANATGDSGDNAAKYLEAEQTEYAGPVGSLRHAIHGDDAATAELANAAQQSQEIDVASN